MTVRYTSSQLDLSRFSAFKLVEWTYSAIKAERLASLRARFEAQGIPFNVDVLESDPSVILQEEDAYREGLDLQAINDTGLGLTLAFATGTKLDLIGNTYFATARLDGETDARYRRRIQLAPENFPGGGTPGGYVYSAMTADPRVKDANCYIDAPGTGNVFVSIMQEPWTNANGVIVDDGSVSDDLFAAVRAHVLSESQKLATDNVTIVRATPVHFAVQAEILLPPGVSSGAAIEQAKKRFNIEAAARHILNMPFPREAMASALHIANAIRVDILAPTTDIDPGPAGCAFCTGLTVTAETFGRSA